MHNRVFRLYCAGAGGLSLQRFFRLMFQFQPMPSSREDWIKSILKKFEQTPLLSIPISKYWLCEKLPSKASKTNVKH